MRRWIVALGAVMAVIGLVTWAAFATGLVIVKKRDVAVPPPDATPQQVVQAYVDALDAHDCAGARTLMAPGMQSEADPWCDDVRNLRVLRMSDAHRVAGETDVDTDLDVRWRIGHDDGSLDGPRFPWSFSLRRTGAGWRIDNMGQG